MASRRFPKERSLRRKINICDPKIRITVVCEGANTEPGYFKRLKQEHANQLVELVTIGAAGVPVTIVDKAIEEQNKLKKEAKRSKDSFDSLCRDHSYVQYNSPGF